MDRELRPAEQRLDRLVRVLGGVSGYMLLWLMVLTVVAVFSRKVLNSPIIGVQDLSEVSLVVVVFFAMSYAGWTGGHIAVDLIAEALPRSWLRLVDIVMRLAGALFFVIVAWQSAERAIEAYAFKEATNLITIPLYPFFWVIAGGFVLFSAVLAVLALRSAAGDSDYPEQ
jgi:TRAP-type C4-dicarboxylate transport system permease small subunit